MRIGIDARMYGPKQGGLGRYVQQLILNLEQLDLPAEFVIFLKKDNWEEYTPSKPNFKKVLADIPWYGWKEHYFLPKIIREQQIDLMHFPHWNVPFFLNTPYVVTVHDLILFHFPTREASTLGPVAYFFKQIGFKLVLKNAVKKAKKVITISEFSKKDIFSTLKVPETKIAVTYPAPQTFKADPIDLEALGIAKPFALYVGVAYPHKNLERLLEAWQKFADQKYQLVLVGKKNFFYDRLISKFEPLFASKSVIFTDFIPDDKLGHIYKSASLYVFPSLYEGFGIPPLEAMSHGVPVISSDSSCLPEVLKDAALYFDAKNISSISEAIKRGFADENLRQELKINAEKLLPQYSWVKLAKQTWEQYQNGV